MPAVKLNADCVGREINVEWQRDDEALANVSTPEYLKMQHSTQDIDPMM